MAVTGIVNGYYMYMNPYDAGSAAMAGTDRAGAYAEYAGKNAMENIGNPADGGAAGSTGNLPVRMPLTVGVPPVPEIALSATGMPLPLGSEAEDGLSTEESADPNAQKNRAQVLPGGVPDLQGAEVSGRFG